MSEEEAQARLKKEIVAAAARPELPVYRPRETRRKIGFSTGTGFLVTADGYLVTNFHVIEDSSQVFVVSDGKEIHAKVVVKDEKNDIAVLKADVTGRPIVMPAAVKVEVAEEVMTLGYPLISIQGQTLKASFGRINSLSGLADDPRFMQIDVPIQPGNSGGPLINARGELVGVVTATLNQIVTLRETGTLPQNVNYAVKSDYVLPLLKTLGEMKRTSSIQGFKSLVRDYRDAIFLVVAK
jgi:S1-C subfamily serine protease